MPNSQRNKGEVVPAEDTLRLMTTVGPSRAARYLGVSTTTLHKARNSQEVSKVIEVASAGVLRGLSAEPTKHLDTFILEVEHHKTPLVEKFAEMVSARLRHA